MPDKTFLAFRYYQEKHPERNYDKDQARRQLAQDSNIDERLLLRVLKQIFKEQKEML
jgi:hypothetical protein